MWNKMKFTDEDILLIGGCLTTLVTMSAVFVIGLVTIIRWIV